MKIDVVIWATIKTKGLEPNNINMEVDVDATIWSTTKTKGLKASSVNYNLINNKNRRPKMLQHPHGQETKSKINPKE
jgi:hypothetical protein